MPNPLDEAKKVVEVIFDELGTAGITRGPCPYVDGKDAIEWMFDKGYPSYTELEWPGYYIKHLTQDLCKTEYPGKIEPYSIKKQHMVKGKYLWDIRLRSLAAESNDVILFDTENQNSLLDEHNGLGLIIYEAVMNYDIDDEFREWLLEFKGGLSDYEKQREEEGRPVRLRKTGFMIVLAYAFHFTKDEFLKGVEDGWLRNDFQLSMRNALGQPRNPKYLLHLDKVPKEYCLFVRNFNSDREEFKSDFGDPDWGHI